jgi:hypothetical protein
MNLNFPLLTAEQIEVKVKQVTAKGAVLLLYKTARTDMELLDAVVGPMNWAVDYREIKGNLYCGIGITEDGERWVWKWDCGIESRADGDGNEKKGEASDAFKRAGFKWGVGRELYTSPFTFAKVETVQSGSPGRYEMKDRFARFTVKEIGYEGRSVSRLVITDNHGMVVFSYGKGAMPVGSAEAAQEAGRKKLEELNAKAAEAAQKPVRTPRKPTQEQLDYIKANASDELYTNAMTSFGIELENMTAGQAAKMIERIKAEKESA